MPYKRLNAIYNKVPVDYYQKGVEKNFLQRFWHRRKYALCKKIIKELQADQVTLSNNTRSKRFRFRNILDVGCASGLMISEIAKDLPEASFTGVDVYKKAINFARKRYQNIDFLVSRAEKLPFYKKKFDLVISYETIEHVENPERMLFEIKRILRNGGVLILSMDSGSILFRVTWFFWEKTFGNAWKNTHVHPFNHQELENLTKKVGFRVKEKLFSHFGMAVTFVLV